MVTRYGMSAAVGPSTAPTAGLVYDPTVAREVRALVKDAYNTARDLLAAHTTTLARLAEALLSQETIEGHALESLLAGAVRQDVS